VRSKDDVKSGQFYFDYAKGRIYLIDDPTGHKIEATIAAFAFESSASNVLIKNLIIEKYASVAQSGAIDARGAVGWIIENCEIRLNSGAGIASGVGSRISGCNIHDNGQIGIAGGGRDILIENNRIWANNLNGFSARWEAGGVKIARGDGVVIRGNDVHDNFGPGLWCDIDCRHVLYEGNRVERNFGAGIMYEISFDAVIRNNVVRHNGIAEKEWFWGDEVLIAASQGVNVYGNTLAVGAGYCGIMLIDQSRSKERGGKYKTRNNSVQENDMTFEGEACVGGASDAKLGDENFNIITQGDNFFDKNVYRVPRDSGPGRFPWGHQTLNWERLRASGMEQNGRLLTY
jgi:hypothetical protein